MNKIAKQKGFTLVEIIVSLAIFTIVALVAVGALIKVMDANRKSITLKTTINNLNFALESMTRELRVGKNYFCKSGSNPDFGSGNDCAKNNQPWVITFTSSNMNNAGTCKLKYAYRYKDQTFEKAQQLKTTTDCSEELRDDFTPLISSEVTINSAIINVSNTSSGIGQPRIFLFIKGVSGVKEKDKTEFAVQTTISQRLPK